MSPLLRALGVLSALELASLVALIANLLTAHDETVSSVLGPVHGAFYLAVACTALLGRGLSARTRVGAVLPGLSGPLTLVNLRREAR
ncbi:hypothetical protein [Aeromicrobium sp. NPDC092404]|uniref:hypothetical protein n=1 Tax=Aeromicrobium sp. NPDC092404 TaxID=3154976 RepID=UPI0034211360